MKAIRDSAILVVMVKMSFQGVAGPAELPSSFWYAPVVSPIQNMAMKKSIAG